VQIEEIYLLTGTQNLNKTYLIDCICGGSNIAHCSVHLELLGWRTLLDAVAV